MPLVNFANLDFDQIKTTIKDYLRSNSNFTDYDFEGSNLSTIIDVLAYNTYITSYNANMVSNEVFIDSATLRENVVSLARNIGYTPTSKKAAKANISFFVDTTSYSSTPQTVTLNKGLVCTTNVFNNESFTFAVLDDITVPVNQNVANFENIEITEGIYITTNFTVNSFDPNQRFILPNSNIDTQSIRVTVKPSKLSNTSRKYRKSESLFEIDGESPIYFCQEIENERYELIFGDGVFGKKLESPSFIEVSYLITNGESANGIGSFEFSGKLTSSRDSVNLTAGISLLATDNIAAGGKNIETIESIKKYSTRIYSSQNRAVTSADYEAILPTIYPEADSVSAFGGEELTPPQFGKVFVSVKPTNGAYLSGQIKENIKSQIKKYSVSGIVVDIIDLKYLYIEPDITAYYNANLAKSANSITTIVSENVETYSKSAEINKFGARFKYSKFLNLIDGSSEGITSNITTITIRRDLRVALNSFAEYEICYGNRFFVKEGGYNIKSSGFNIAGISATVYLTDMPDDNHEKGTIDIFALDSPTQPRIVKKSVGVIDYIKGEIKLSPINITNTVIQKGFPLIEISAIPYSNDVIGLQDLYLQIDLNQTEVTSKPDNIASGVDVSGSNYLVTSSYTNGSLVRGGPVYATESVVTTTTTTRVGNETMTSTTTSTTSSTSSGSASGGSSGGGSTGGGGGYGGGY
jgi:hypothetical protein